MVDGPNTHTLDSLDLPPDRAGSGDIERDVGVSQEIFLKKPNNNLFSFIGRLQTSDRLQGSGILIDSINSNILCTIFLL